MRGSVGLSGVGECHHICLYVLLPPKIDFFSVSSRFSSNSPRCLPLNSPSPASPPPPHRFNCPQDRPCQPNDRTKTPCQAPQHEAIFEQLPLLPPSQFTVPPSPLPPHQFNPIQQSPGLPVPPNDRTKTPCQAPQHEAARTEHNNAPPLQCHDTTLRQHNVLASGLGDARVNATTTRCQYTIILRDLHLPLEERTLYTIL